jgi:hypothetical protein
MEVTMVAIRTVVERRTWPSPAIYVAAMLLVVTAVVPISRAAADDLIIEMPAPPHEARPPGARGEAPRAIPDVRFEPWVMWPRTPEANGGLALWITPNVPVGPEASGWRDLNGWLGAGIVWTW